jgi:hypothetical protein
MRRTIMRSNLAKRQQGMTFISWLLVLGIVGFFAMIGLTMVPVYLEHYSIKHVLMSFEQEHDLSKKSPSEIRALMKKRLKINGVYEFDVRNNLKIKRLKAGTEVRVQYEVRKPVVGNVDLVMSFDDSITR